MITKYSKLYDEYKIRHNNAPKHKFPHFITILLKIHHHRELIRPSIKWWSEII